MRPVPSKEMAWPPAVDHYHIQTHGGLGDTLWVMKKFAHPGMLPVFLSISEENRQRPRRCGIMADHLTMVCGWRYAGTTFAPGGRDWPERDDPACALGKTWQELAFHANTKEPYRLECNRWLEGGRRIDDWLPDLPTTHHFPFVNAGPARIAFQTPYVVFHLAGWPDVTDKEWRALIREFKGVAHVYVVGGTYDRRPRTVSAGLPAADVTLLEDLPWADLHGLLSGCEYCFGHASGFTAVADVMARKAVVVNPSSVPRLTGTWNSTENANYLYVKTVHEFVSGVEAALEILATGNRATWPPDAGGRRLRATIGVDDSPVRNTSYSVTPRNIMVVADGPAPDWLGSAALGGVYDRGKVVDAIVLVGCSVDAAAAAMKESGRTTRRPVIDQVGTQKDCPRTASGVDLAVVYATDPASGFAAAQEAWRRMTARGTLLVGGPSAGPAARAVAQSLRVEAGSVADAVGWYFIHRRL